MAIIDDVRKKYGAGNQSADIMQKVRSRFGDGSSGDILGKVRAKFPLQNQPQ